MGSDGCRRRLVRRPNGVPTPVPKRASRCPRRDEFVYGVPARALTCTSLGRPGNAVGGETRHEGSNPSRSAFPLADKAFGPHTLQECASKPTNKWLV